jgi:hypothetical protein
MQAPALGQAKDCTAALRIPCLPEDAPAAPTPLGMRLPLRPHQARALYRCLQIERDGSLSSAFGVSRVSSMGEHIQLDFKSRGGVLADAVGMGKTATALALALAADEPGPSIVVAPSHLLHQWESEARKFVSAGAMLVVVGLQALNELKSCRLRDRRVLVLVDVEEVLSSPRLWYNFRRVFRTEQGPEVHVSADDRELYKQCALCCVRSPKGPCSYEGWVYKGPLHIPRVPWRRVFLDEIQDLVKEGSDAQKCLMQLARTSRSVWLMSATPFPHGNESVRANHELLGFCRLKLDVESERELPSTHPFELIKSKLYIRSPGHVKAAALDASAAVTHELVRVPSNPVEAAFYDAEVLDARALADGALDHVAPGWGSAWEPLRQQVAHPEASPRLRTEAGACEGAAGSGVSLLIFARRWQAEAIGRISEITKRELPRTEQTGCAARNSLECARELLALHRVANLRALQGEARPIDADERRRVVHDTLCPKGAGCSLRRHTNSQGLLACRAMVLRRVLTEEQRNARLDELITGSQADMYLLSSCASEDALARFASRCEAAVESKARTAHALAAEVSRLETRCAALGSALGTCGKAGAAVERATLAMTHGAKPAALLTYLRALAAREPGVKTIVFSMWHETLKLVAATLARGGVRAALVEGSAEAMCAVLADFCRAGAVDVLLMSARSKASGANLQVATHVILLDPAGLSAAHGAALEQQAIGRAVRMGQTRPVTVTRFCVDGTLEADLIAQIRVAAAAADARAHDTSYQIKPGKRALETLGVERADAPDADVAIVLERTFGEREAAKWAEARARGAIVALDDNDDAAGELISPGTHGAERRDADARAAHKRCRPGVEPVRVKPEPGLASPVDGADAAEISASLTRPADAAEGALEAVALVDEGTSACARTPDHPEHAVSTVQRPLRGEALDTEVIMKGEMLHF